MNFLDVKQAQDELEWIKNHNSAREYMLVKVLDPLELNDDVPF